MEEKRLEALSPI